MKKLPNNIIKDYNKSRSIANTGILCWAPFTNINFAQNGNMTACCFNRSHVLGKFPYQSISEAWFGESAEQLRTYIQTNDLGGGCKLCQLALESGNFAGSKAVHFDDYAPSAILEASGNFLQRLFGKKEKQVAPPRVLEFELDNTCNLECVMCDGYFSSTIRSQREKLPAVKNPYNDTFVEQVAEFLPHVTDLKFLGGEPFLIEVYLKIWEKVIAINPGIKIHITTNGNVLNQRIKDLLERLHCGIVVSMDSLDKDIYASIRKRGNLDKVLENLQYFQELTTRKKTYLSIAVCPMRSNWAEMPLLVDFANARGISIHFNIVWNPADVSLRFESSAFLANVTAVYNNYQPALNNHISNTNFQIFKALVNQVQYWQKEKAQMERHQAAVDVKAIETTAIQLENQITRTCISLLLNQLSKEHDERLKARDELLAFSRTMDADIFTKAYFDAVQFILKGQKLAVKDLKERFAKIALCVTQLSDKTTFVNDLIWNGFESQMGYLVYEDLDQLLSTITARYSMDTAPEVLT